MPTEQEKLLQLERLGFLQNEALRGPWLTICDPQAGKDGLSLNCALIQKDKLDQVLQDIGWELRYGSGGPSVCTHYGPDGQKTVYEKNPNEWIEHLAVYRSFPSRETYVELAEDFRSNAYTMSIRVGLELMLLSVISRICSSAKEKPSANRTVFSFSSSLE